MHGPQVLSLIFCWVSSASLVEGQESSAGVSRTYEEAVAALPQSERHHFAAVDPAWRQSVSFQCLRPDAFVTVENPSEQEKASLYKEARYFDDTAPDPRHAVKILTFRPGGKLYSEIDATAAENFCCDYSSAGAFASFVHWRQAKWIAGVAVDPQTGRENHFTDGAGSLTTYNEAGCSRVTWYQDGNVFLVVDRDGNHRTMVRLDVEANQGEDCLIARPGKEELMLDSKREIWTRQVDGAVTFEIIGDQNNGDVPTLPVFRSGRPSERIEERRTFAAWQTIYHDKRRPDFMKRYAQILSAAGQSWESLHIVFIRDGAPWPDR